MSKDHIHKYKKTKLGQNGKVLVYRCMLPDCKHYMPDRKLVIGQKSICWECDDVFIIGADIIRKMVTSPRCLKCRGKITKDKKFDNVLDILIGNMKG